jgi:hypothetical protein
MFTPNKNTKSGRVSACKPCLAAVAKARYVKKRGDPKTADEINRDRWQRMLGWKYGITVEQYLEMESAQEGVCAICGRPERRAIRGREGVRRLSVDHCHETGKIRALLCGDCNTFIGFAEESGDRLSAAIAYIQSHKVAT